MPGKPPVVRVVSAAVLVDAPARVTRTADGRLEVMLRADLPLTAPVGDLITDAIDSEWPHSDEEPATGHAEQVQASGPGQRSGAQLAEGAARATAVARRVRELVRGSCWGALSSRRTAAPDAAAVAFDRPLVSRGSAWSGWRSPVWLAVVTSILLVSTLFADSGTDDDPGDGHFGFAADGVQPSNAVAVYVRPRDDPIVSTNG